jgi:hypothetical protein
MNAANPVLLILARYGSVAYSANSSHLIIGFSRLCGMKKFLTFTAVSVLLLLTAVAITLPLAHLYASEAQRLLDEWLVTDLLVAAVQETETGAEERLEADAPPKWLRERVQRFSALAARLDPLNPVPASTLGYLHGARFSEESQAADLQQALEYYRRAIALRPTAPHGWTSLTQLKLNQGTLDEEFALGMQRAMILGPWERSVQFAILETALPEWPALSEELRAAIRLGVDRSLQTDPATVMDLVEQYGYIRGTISEEEALELGLIEASETEE